MNTSKAEQERLDILRRYRRLIEVWHTRKEVKDRWDVRKAFRLAADFHKDKRRKSGEPYIIHPLEVATICAGEIGLGRTSIIAALLHDTVEDTELKLEDIEAMFGVKVAKIIDGLTKIDTIEGKTDTVQVLTLRKILMTLSDDVRVILIKLADRLHNMRTLDAMKPEQQLRTSSETLYLYAPIAYRLGLYNIKTELEDLALKFTEPVAYKDIHARLNKIRPQRDLFLKDVIPPLKKAVSKFFPHTEIFVNERSAMSLWKKMKNNLVTIDDFDHTYSLDIVIDNGDAEESVACWQAYAAVSSVFKSDNNFLHDYIATPKVNGYQAIHALLLGPEGRWVEVHIRSTRMHEVAQRGYAAFWEYKDLMDENHNLNVWINKTKSLLTTGELNAVKFLEAFKEEFLSDVIEVFTPMGEIKSLPVGATILDFAYLIHSDLGNHCAGAIINKRKLVNPVYKLEAGDKVKVITSNAIEPTEEWYNIVVTSTAKSGIENYIKNKRKKFKAEGERKLREIFKQLKMEYSKILVGKLMEYFKYNSPIDLFYFVAIDAIDAKAVKDALMPDENKRSWYNRLIPFKSKNQQEEGNDDSKNKSKFLYKGDLNQLDHVIARCCNPLPGENVIGIAIPGEPIQVHRTDCPEAHRLMSIYGKNLIKVHWKEAENIDFPAGLHIVAEDVPGLMLDIGKLFFERFKLNIRSFHMVSKDMLTETDVTFYISSEKKLEAVKSSLKKLKAVKSVTRITEIDRI